MKAHIIKIISNQYTISLADGMIAEAFCTGKMRLKDQLFVGDYVEVGEFEGRYGIIDIYPRKNVLKRPFLANVDQAFILMSYDDPKFSYELVNRLIIMIEVAKVKPLVVCTKADLATSEGLKAIGEYYESMNYPFFFTTNKSFNKELYARLKGKISVFCGQSGVGKSSLLNVIDPKLNLRTNITSKALGRGKHTTRHVELFNLGEGLVADSPGFSSLDLSGIKEEDLEASISAFDPYRTCFYRDCKHLNEPDCGIKKAVAENHIKASFYATYKEMLKMIQSGNIYAYAHRRLK